MLIANIFIRICTTRITNTNKLINKMMISLNTLVDSIFKLIMKKNFKLLEDLSELGAVIWKELLNLAANHKIVINSKRL